MSEVGVPYKKQSSRKRKFKVPPPPDIPAPTPEVPPPSGPIPGEPSPSKEQQIYLCPFCNMKFTNEDALKLHISSTHPNR